MAQTPKKVVDPETLKKISEGARYVKIPDKDLYGANFEGFHFASGHGRLDENPASATYGKYLDKAGKEVTPPYDGHFEIHLKPGTHLLSATVADEVEKRLAIWQESMVRMMRPGAHMESQQQATRRGMDIVANPEDME